MKNHICPNPKCQNMSNKDIKLYDKKRQRLICKLCGRTWYKNKLIAPNHKVELQIYNRALQLLTLGISIRKTAEYTQCAPSTILRWKQSNKINL